MIQTTRMVASAVWATACILFTWGKSGLQRVRWWL